jgi:hypothetical protein
VLWEKYQEMEDEQIWTAMSQWCESDDTDHRDVCCGEGVQCEPSCSLQTAWTDPCVSATTFDSYGFGCAQYTGSPDECGVYDDEDFSASAMCCECPGNKSAIASDESSDALCNIVTDVAGVSMVCPRQYLAHAEQRGICFLRAEGGPGGVADPRVYMLPSHKSWPNSRWMIPTPGAPTLDGASYYFDHGVYTTSGAPLSLCAPETNETANETMTWEQSTHIPVNGTCALNYQLRTGALANYGKCDESEEVGYCILPPEKAAILCEEDPLCAGVSETTNEGWKASYPGYQLLGRLPVSANSEWTSCLKAGPARTWDSELKQTSERRAEALVGGFVDFHH